MWEIEKLVKKGDYLYAKVRNHPYATKYGYVLHHRIVMENHLGRLLDSSEIVHHINHNKHDNRVENLQVMEGKQHTRMHNLENGVKMVTCKCPICSKVFDKPYNKTYQGKGLKGNHLANCCSRVCGNKLGREKQLNRLTPEMKTAISGNILKIYRKYNKDNPEEILD